MESRYHRSEIKEPWRFLYSLWLQYLLLVALSSSFGYLIHRPAFAQENPAVQAPFIPDGPASESVLEALWRVGMYATANEVCEAQLKLLAADSDGHIRWTCWLIRGLAAEAVELEDRIPPEREKSEQNWERIVSLSEQSKTTASGSFRLPWLSWQILHATHLRAQGHMARYLANPLDTASREEALAAIRELDRGTEQLRKLVSEQVTKTSAATTAEARRQIRELQELSTETALLRCEALLLRGQAYPSQSADAIAAGTEMEQAALEAAGKVSPDWSGNAKLELALATSKWLLGSFGEAIENLKGLLDSNDSRVRQRALDLLVQCALQADQRSEAEAAIRQFRSAAATPEYALAEMRLALFDLPKASDAAEVRQRALTSLLSARDAIGERFGSYWQRRAEALLVTLKVDSKNISSMTNSNESTELVRIEVRQLLAASRFQEAAAKLVQQAALLNQQEQKTVAMQLTLQAAAILQKQSQWSEAGKLFRNAAREYRDEKQASSAHLMAIYCTSQQIRQDPKENNENLKLLDELFTEQLHLFPDDVASLQAALQYAQSGNARRVWSVVAEKLRPFVEKVSFPDRLAWLVVELDLRSIYWQHPEGDAKTVELLKQAIEKWESLIKKGGDDSSLLPLKKLGIAAIVVLLDLSPESVAFQLEEQAQWEVYRQDWLAMKYLPEEAGYLWKEAWNARMAVEKEVAEKKTVSADSIETLIMLSGAQNGEANPSSGSQMLQPSIAMWGASERIAENAELLQPDQRFMSRAALVELSQLINRSIQSSSWKFAPNDRVERLQWRLGAIGEGRVEALATVNQRIASQPRLAAWQRTKAVLLEAGNQDDLEQALEIYRRLASGARIGSEEWIRARYRSALCLLWIGEKDGALQTAEVIKLTHPPKHSVWQQRWDELLKLKP